MGKSLIITEKPSVAQEFAKVLRVSGRNDGYIENGLLIVVLTLSKYDNRLLAGPDIVSRGFVYVRESEMLMEDARKLVDAAVQKCLDGRVSDWSKIKSVIRDTLSDYVWKQTKRNPMILPIIMEVDV